MHFIQRYGLLFILLFIVIMLQAQLWCSHGGVEKVLILKKSLAVAQNAVNEAQTRNARLIEEVKRIQNSRETIETQARYDLGMVKQGEEYVQIVPSE